MMPPLLSGLCFEITETEMDFETLMPLVLCLGLRKTEVRYGLCGRNPAGEDNGMEELILNYPLPPLLFVSS